MNVNYLNNRQTALLFFDMLNVYYHGAPEETKKRMKPAVDNAVRLMNTARQNGILVAYAMANHRPDGESRSMIVTDTDIGPTASAIRRFMARRKARGSKRSSRKLRRARMIT